MNDETKRLGLSRVSGTTLSSPPVYPMVARLRFSRNDGFVAASNGHSAVITTFLSDEVVVVRVAGRVGSRGWFDRTSPDAR